MAQISFLYLFVHHNSPGLSSAALVGAIGLGSYWMVNLRALSGEGAVVEARTGDVFLLAGTDQMALDHGESIDYGDRIRTGAGESAFLQLQDGSILEMRERSWLSVRANRRGTTIDLDGGWLLS